MGAWVYVDADAGAGGGRALSCFALWSCYGTLDGRDTAEGKGPCWCTLLVHARAYTAAEDISWLPILLLPHLILVG